MFNMKSPTFDRLIMNFLHIISLFAYKKFAENVCVDYTFGRLESARKLFEKFPVALEAVHVTFHMSNRPARYH